MKKKSFKIISLSLALLLLASIIVPTALASDCIHVHLQICSDLVRKYISDEVNHQYVSGHYYRCLECGAEIFVTYSADTPEPHTDIISSILSQRHDSLGIGAVFAVGLL